MSVGVVGADLDQRHARNGAVEQRLEAGVVAAVMSDLEDVERPRDRDASPRPRRRRSTARPSPATAPRGRASRRSGLRSAPYPRGGQRTSIRRAPNRSALPSATGTTRAPASRAAASMAGAGRPRTTASTRWPASTSTQAAGVIELVVGDEHRRERADAEPVERLGGRAARRAGVDQHRVSTGALEQRRIALADVESRDPEPGGGWAGRRRSRRRGRARARRGRPRRRGRGPAAATARRRRRRRVARTTATAADAPR